jgi:alpha-L-fucosidase
MDSPRGDILIKSLGKKSKVNNQRIASISMLGSNEKLKWEQKDDALKISKLAQLPKWRVPTFKIEFKN